MTKRLNKELQRVQEENLDWCTCGPADDNILHWNATIMGEEETPYFGGVFHIDIQFPDEYPFKAPEVHSYIPFPHETHCEITSFFSFFAGKVHHEDLSSKCQV